MHILAIIGRIAAGCVAALAFYMAFFMYEDEQGRLQNRLVDLWVSVYARAEITDNVTTALFNKIGEKLNMFFAFIFGERMFAAKAVAISINLSLCGGFLAIAAINKMLPPGPHHISDVGGVGACLKFAFLFFMLAQFPIVFRGMWAVYVSGSTCAAIMVITLRLFFDGVASQEAVQGQVYILMLSVLCDVSAVFVLRKMFALISTTLSVTRILLSIGAALAFAFLISMAPLKLITLIQNHLSPEHSAVYGAFAIELMFFNVTTAFFCLIPALMLIVLLLHKLFWPVTARAVYSLYRYRLFTSRVALAGIGSLATILALHPATLTIEKVLKYFV